MVRGVEVLSDHLALANLIDADMNELRIAVATLIHDAAKPGHRMGFAGHLFKWLAFIAAIYLLILDRTNWRSNMLTSLLVPYIFLSLPNSFFHVFRGDVGKWIALVAVVLRLFMPRHFPDWLEIPGSMILVLVAAPDFIAYTMKDSWAGVGVLLIIGCYLLQEHIRATGGVRNSFTKRHGISNTIGLLLLLVYPVWAMLFYIM
ncbi:cold-regulated 413 plasma membrane protein 2-like [Silene latifolia]|uniref:cold-regulated 413 plasma membrane protein 2-like n=1 Tax=Silene latifolia TaxID=37657 RepID=UPI003D76E105